MFNDRKLMKDVYGYRQVKKRVPFSVVNMKATTAIQAKAELEEWRSKVEVRNEVKRKMARDRAVAAFCVDSTLLKPMKYTVEKVQYKSIITRCYEYLLNLFLDIKF